MAEGPETIAAFIGEPITGAAAGAMVPPDGYWQQVAEVCGRHGILMIADEVMTGLGRTGLNWGHQHFGFTTDIIVAGKGLSGGYAPMGGVYTRNDIVEPIAKARLDLMYHTFSGYDLGCAISRRVLEIIRDEGLVQRCATVGERLKARLVERLGDHPNVADVRGRGLMLGVELVRDRDGLVPFPREVEFARRVVAEALERGVWVYPAGSGRCHRRVEPDQRGPTTRCHRPRSSPLSACYRPSTSLADTSVSDKPERGTRMEYGINHGPAITEQEALAQASDLGLHAMAFDVTTEEDETLHWHEFAAVTWVIEGTGALCDKDGTVTEIGPGCRLDAPAGFLHRALAGPRVRLVLGTDLPYEQWTMPIDKDPADLPDHLAV